METSLRPVGLERRLRWLLFGRLAVAICGMAVILGGQVLREGLRRIPEPAAGAYYTLFAACAVSLVYLVLFRPVRNLRVHAWIQIVGDVALETLLIYFTGVDSVFAYLYFASVIAAAMILSGTASLFVASLATVMLSAAFIAHYVAARVTPGPDVPRVLTEVNFLVVHLLFFALSLHIVAVLAGRLAGEASRVRIVSEEILQNMADGVVTVDSEGRLTYVNPAALRQFGRPAEGRWEGRPCEDLGVAPLARALREALATGGRAAAETVVARPGADPATLDVTASAVEGRGPRVRGAVAIVHDVTLRQAMAEMEKRTEKFRALVEMSAGVAHEIRNPLASIRGAAQALHGDPALAPDDRRLLEIVVRESDRLEGIISSFLEFARNKPPALGDADMAGILREVALLLQSRPDADGCAIAVDAEAAAPCRCDSDQMKQVLLNLGLNAVDAARSAPDGPRRVTLRIRRGQIPRWVWVEVADTGPGIPAEDRDRIFEPFFSSKPQGTGMGLAIARRIVEAHGGEITFESAPGRGTVFRIGVPG